MQKQVEKAAWIIALINRVFPNFTNHTYDFRPSRPILEEFDVEEYVNLACQGVEEHLLKKI
jgi:fatty acyl-CoA reductase